LARKKLVTKNFGAGQDKSTIIPTEIARGSGLGEATRCKDEPLT